MIYQINNNVLKICKNIIGVMCFSFLISLSLIMTSYANNIQNIETFMNEELINNIEEVEAISETYITGKKYEIAPNKRYIIATLNKKKGETIRISVTSENKKKIYVGVKTPDGKYPYKATASTTTYTFSISTTGIYKVFIQNVDKTVAKVSITIK